MSNHRFNFRKTVYFWICLSLLVLIPCFSYSSKGTDKEPVIQMPMAGGVQTPAFQSLDGEWDFLPIDAKFDEITTGKYSDQWGTINVPALWWEAKLPSTSKVNWTGKSPADSSNSNRPLYQTIPYAWYRKKFAIASEFTTFNSRILFGCVKWSGEAWLNGHLIGSHLGGYSPFDLDISPYMKPGKENELLVKVGGWGSVPFTKDGKPQIPAGTVADWSNKSGGIPESVILRYYRRVAIESVFAIPHADTKTVQIRVTIKNPKDLMPEDKLDIYVTEKKSPEPINQMTVDIDQDTETGIAGAEIVLDIPDAKLWWPWSPNLYRISCEVRDKKSIPLDIQEETFGLRDFQIKDGHFYLNGQRIQLRGANLFQESAFAIGSEASLDPKFVKQYLVDVARQANIGVFRTHLGPMNRRWLDLCDANGVMVISEFPLSQLSNNWEDAEFTKNAVKEYKELIPFLWNHPSIVMWSISNESWSNEKRVAENNYIYPMIKELDPSRPILRAGDESKDIADIHAYEGVWYKTMDDFRNRVENLKKIRPDKPVMCTEYLETGSNESGVWYDQERAKMHLGDHPAPEQMLLKHAELAAIQTEILRLNRFDGIFPYWYADWVNLGSWVQHKDDKDYPHKKLTFYALKNALAPVAIILDIQSTQFISGKTVTVPVKVMNDSPINVPIRIDVYVFTEDPWYQPDRVKEFSPDTQFFDTSSSVAPAYGMVAGNVKIPIPKNIKGTFYLVASLTRTDSQDSVLSQRKILIEKPTVVPKKPKASKKGK